MGTDLSWLVLGSQADTYSDDAKKYGAKRLRFAADSRLTATSPDALVEAIAQYAALESPGLLLFCQDFESRVVAPRVAGRIGAAVVMNGVEIEAKTDAPLRITASAYGGDTRVVYEIEGDGTSIVGIQANSIAAEAADSPADAPAEPFDVDLATIEERICVLEAAKAEGARLEEAEIIVSGGRGLGSPENYKLIEQLAEALGGMAGASRPIVDEGWTDASHQVGLTGRITRPGLYVAAGISGASQHMAGCGAAKTIAAINNDPAAAIFRYARYGIVGDCLEILPELIRAAQEKG